MINPLTIVTFMAFLASGLYVFQTKEEVAKLDRELRDIRRETEAERGRAQTLSAEWARLNDQDRLRAMAANHLRHMQPMEPAQFQRIEDAQRRMPQAVAFTPVPSGFQRRADAPSAPGDVLIFTAANMLPAPEPAVALAAVRPAAPRIAPPEPVAAPAAPPAPFVVIAPPARVAEVQRAVEPPRVVAPTPPRPRPEQRPEVAALPPIAGPASSPARPPAQIARAAPTAPPIAMRTALHVQPVQGSMLGAAGSLPPPVPFAR